MKSRNSTRHRHLMVVDFFFLLEGASCINLCWHVASVVSYIFFLFLVKSQSTEKK